MDLKGSSGNGDLNCSLWIWSWALQVSQWASCTAQGLWKFDIVDFAYCKSCWSVCRSRCESLQSLWKDFLFFCSAKCCKHFSTRSLLCKHFLSAWLDSAEHPGRHSVFVLQNMPSVGLEGSDSGCKWRCSLLLHFSPTAIGCDPVHNRCCLILAMLGGSLAIVFVGNCKLWKYLFWLSMLGITKSCETKGNAWCGEEGKGLKGKNVFICLQWWAPLQIHTHNTYISND